MKASVIIPVWNGRKYLPDCLEALFAQRYPDLEVIAVDNASSDDSADWIAERYPQVRLIRNPVNRGFAGGCNSGLQVAQGDILVLLNQDTRVLPGWLQAIVDALRRPEVGIVGCKILYPDGETIQHAGGWIEWPLGFAHHYGQGERDEGQWDEPRQVDYVTGAAMAFRRTLLDTVGLLDEEFWPGYFEDTDFCFRAREAGYKIWYVPNAVAIHAEGASTPSAIDHSLYNERGRLRFVLKHMAPDRFLNEFIPAEREHLLPATGGPDGEPLRIAYLEAIPVAARILKDRWNADESTVETILLALQSLYLFPTAQSRVDGKEQAFPSLQEFEFRSTLPVVGPLIAWFRSLWYSVAARWAVRDLIRQQAAINQLQERRIRSLEWRITEESILLTRQITWLIQEVKALRQQEEV